MPRTERNSFEKTLRRLVACNPFYISSAVLVLLGIYLVSVDKHFFEDDRSQLIFNFSSLQLYEISLVVTAVLLARRKVIYDCVLLIVIENIFVFVPFILLNGAIYINTQLVWVICVIAVFTVGLRFLTLKRGCRGLLLPARLLLFGLLFLLLNIALPLIFRSYVGSEDLNAGEKQLQLYTVLACVVLPVLFLLPNFLARLKGWPERLDQQPWLPFVTLNTWAGLTGFHLLWIAYVNDIPLELRYFVPALWVLSWTMANRFHDLFREGRELLHRCLVAAPVAASLLLYNASMKQFAMPLAILNGLIYVFLVKKRRYPNQSLYLAAVSFASLIPVIPSAWGSEVLSFSHQAAVVYGLLFTVAALAVLAKHPVAGLAGACSVGLLVVRLFSTTFLDYHSGITLGITFFLLHSLRWRDEAHPGCRFMRGLAAWSWAAYSLAMAAAQAGWNSVLLNAASALVVTFFIFFCYRRAHRPGSLPILLGTVLAVFSLPLKCFLVMMQEGATGPLVMLAAFGLFSAGTWLAYRKRANAEESSSREPGLPATRSNGETEEQPGAYRS